VGAIRAGLAALQAGEAEAAGAIAPAELREALGYGDYERIASAYIASD
jgi:hypothetical protein